MWKLSAVPPFTRGRPRKRRHSGKTHHRIPCSRTGFQLLIAKRSQTELHSQLCTRTRCRESTPILRHAGVTRSRGLPLCTAPRPASLQQKPCTTPERVDSPAWIKRTLRSDSSGIPFAATSNTIAAGLDVETQRRSTIHQMEAAQAPALRQNPPPHPLHQNRLPAPDCKAFTNGAVFAIRPTTPP